MFFFSVCNMSLYQWKRWSTYCIIHSGRLAYINLFPCSGRSRFLIRQRKMTTILLWNIKILRFGPLAKFQFATETARNCNWLNQRRFPSYHGRIFQAILQIWGHRNQFNNLIICKSKAKTEMWLVKPRQHLTIFSIIWLTRLLRG